jgi:hypothetical protein
VIVGEVAVEVADGRGRGEQRAPSSRRWQPVAYTGSSAGMAGVLGARTPSGGWMPDASRVPEVLAHELLGCRAISRAEGGEKFAVLAG